MHQHCPHTGLSKPVSDPEYHMPLKYPRRLGRGFVHDGGTVQQGALVNGEQQGQVSPPSTDANGLEKSRQTKGIFWGLEKLLQCKKTCCELVQFPSESGMNPVSRFLLV